MDTASEKSQDLQGDSEDSGDREVMSNLTIWVDIYGEIRYNMDWEEGQDGVVALAKIFYEVLNHLDNPYEAIGYFQGAATLVYAKKDTPESMYIYRDGSRPLFRGTIKDDDGNKGVYFSSIEEGLEADKFMPST